MKRDTQETQDTQETRERDQTKHGAHKETENIVPLSYGDIRIYGGKRTGTKRTKIEENSVSDGQTERQTVGKPIMVDRQIDRKTESGQRF